MDYWGAKYVSMYKACGKLGRSGGPGGGALPPSGKNPGCQDFVLEIEIVTVLQRGISNKQQCTGTGGLE